MAKGKLALGKFRGKIGGQVLRVDAGIGQIISEYNPHPKNPNTVEQVKQRSKMNLAGRISSVVPYDAIAGLGTSKRNARSAFVSGILKAATVQQTGSANAGHADIAFEKVLFSKGSQIPIVATATMDVQTSVVTVAVSNIGTLTNLIGWRAILIVSFNDEVKSCEVHNMLLEPNTTFDLSYLNPTDNDVISAEAYIVPVIDNGGDARATYGLLMDAERATAYSTSYARTLASLNAFAASVFVAKVTDL